MKKIISIWLLAALAALCLVACGNSKEEEEAREVQEEQTHKIGVVVYNITDEEVMAFRNYLEDYIGHCFTDVDFYYSDSITSEEEELEFLNTACENGAEGILSFLSYDLKAEVETCAENGVYYMLASGTVTDEDFASVENNEYFLGAIGPGSEIEYQAGAEMAQYFADKKDGDSYLIYSGGAALGNEMHRIRTVAILETLEKAYGTSFDEPVEDLAVTEELAKVTAGDMSVCIYPGYINREEYQEGAIEEISNEDYDYIMAVLPVTSITEKVQGVKITLGVIDSYTTGNLTLFTNGDLNYVTGKYSSIIGPSFAAMYNAVSGHAEDFRDNGKAFRITQGFWTSMDMEDYMEKYSLASGIYVNAYNYEDLQNVCKEYNTDANFEGLKKLAEEYTFEDAEQRRGSDGQ